MQSGKGRTPLSLPPEKTHMTEGKAGAGGKEGTRQVGAEDADRWLPPSITLQVGEPGWPEPWPGPRHPAGSWHPQPGRGRP